MSRTIGPTVLQSERIARMPALERRPDPAERAEILDRYCNRHQAIMTIATLLNLRYATVAAVVEAPF